MELEKASYKKSHLWPYRVAVHARLKDHKTPFSHDLAQLLKLCMQVESPKKPSVPAVKVEMKEESDDSDVGSDIEVSCFGLFKPGRFDWSISSFARLGRAVDSDLLSDFSPGFGSLNPSPIT